MKSPLRLHAVEPDEVLETTAQAIGRIYAEAQEQARIAEDQAVMALFDAHAGLTELLGLPSELLSPGLREKYRETAEYLRLANQWIANMRARRPI